MPYLYAYMYKALKNQLHNSIKHKIEIKVNRERGFKRAAYCFNLGKTEFRVIGGNQFAE